MDLAGIGWAHSFIQWRMTCHVGWAVLKEQTRTIPPRFQAVSTAGIDVSAS